MLTLLISVCSYLVKKFYTKQSDAKFFKIDFENSEIKNNRTHMIPNGQTDKPTSPMIEKNIMPFIWPMH